MKSIRMLTALLIVGGLTAATGYSEGDCPSKGKAAPTGDQAQKGDRPSGEERFNAMDADKNGSISKEEWMAAHAKRTEAMKEKLGDKFNADEAAKRGEGFFTKADANGDGAISKDEMKAAHEKMREHGGPGKGPGHHGEKKGEGAPEKT